MSNSLQTHGLQHTRPPCPSLSPRVCSNTCPLSRWCHSTISSSVVLFSSCPQSFPASGLFSSELVLCIWWPKYCSFSFNISPSNEYSGLISFMEMDGLVGSPCSPSNSQDSSPAPQFESNSSLALSHLYGTTFISIHDYWKNHSSDCMELCW